MSCALHAWACLGGEEWGACCPPGGACEPCANLLFLCLPQTITDLLDPSRTNLHVRENLEGVYVANLTAHEVYRGERKRALPAAELCLLFC